MIVFLESPWPILLIGVIVEAVLGLMLLKTQQGRLLLAMIAVAGIVAGGLVVERLVVTEREEVEQTLYDAVAAVKRGNVDGLLGCISPSATMARGQARFVMQRYEVEDAWIRELEITVNRLTSPPSAKAKFMAIGKGRDRQNAFPYKAFGDRVTVDLRREGDRWLVVGYDAEEYSPSRRR